MSSNKQCWRAFRRGDGCCAFYCTGPGSFVCPQKSFSISVCVCSVSPEGKVGYAV